LLRLTWDNGDRTVLVNAELGGVTLGWNLTHTAQDELFAAIEGTAFHTRVILERMAEHGVEIRRVINGGGIPQKNETLNRVYANVLNKPVLVPEGDVTSLGSAIMAFMAADAFESIEAAQQALCPRYRTIEPDAAGSRRVRAALRAVSQAVLRFRQARLRGEIADVAAGARKLAGGRGAGLAGAGLPAPL
jgi:L-ribulokinase